MKRGQDESPEVGLPHSSTLPESKSVLPWSPGQQYFRRACTALPLYHRPPQAGKLEKQLSAISAAFESEKRVLSGQIADASAELDRAQSHWQISSLQSDALKHIEVLAAKAAELHQVNSKLAQSEKNLEQLKQRFAEHEAHPRHAPARTHARAHARTHVMSSEYPMAVSSS